MLSRQMHRLISQASVHCAALQFLLLMALLHKGMASYFLYLGSYYMKLLSEIIYGAHGGGEWGLILEIATPN